MGKRLWIAFGAVMLALCAFLIWLGRDPVVNAQGAAAGSGIRLGTPTALQQESLYKLGKVWGFVKYHHPDLVAGTVDWDEALFAVLPDLWAADSDASANAVLADWLAQYPFTVQTDETAAGWQQLQQVYGDSTLDTGWISDRDFLGEAVCNYLEQLDQTHLGNRPEGYAAFSSQVTGVDFSHEKDRIFRPEDDGLRLLALYRFWNAFTYYSPHLTITPVDWDQALREGIPEMLATDDQEGYLRVLGSLAAKTGDAHVSMVDNAMTLYRFYGSYFLPCSFLVIDGQVVVQYRAEEGCTLEPGDVITAIDGQFISQRVEELRHFFALPEPDKFGTALAIPLLSTAGPTARVEVMRQGTPKELIIYTRRQVFQPENPWKTGTLAEGAIGYIDPSALQEGDLEILMEDFADTRGLIVDLRHYPSVFLPYLLGEYLVPEPTPFAIVTMPNPALPGSFYRLNALRTGAGTMQASGQSTRSDYPLYQGKVALLMDENSVSQSEFTIMALRQCPRAAVIGTPSLGADGNVVSLMLPGNVQTGFTGLGILTPEGGATQQVGLTPDIVYQPTVADLQAGRDALVDKAIEWILQG